MRATWTLLAAFLAAVIFAAGCGGGGEDLGYEDEEDTGTGAAAIGTGEPGADPAAGGTPGDEDPTRGGYAPRVTVGEGQGGVMSKAEFDQWSQLGEKEKQLVDIHQRYFRQKDSDKIDESLRESGISVADQILDALKPMRDANPKNMELESMEQRVGERRRDLVMER